MSWELYIRMYGTSICCFGGAGTRARTPRAPGAFLTFYHRQQIYLTFFLARN